MHFCHFTKYGIADWNSFQKPYYFGDMALRQDSYSYGKLIMFQILLHIGYILNRKVTTKAKLSVVGFEATPLLLRQTNHRFHF